MLFLSKNCQKNANSSDCCHQFRDLNKLLDVDFKLYFDAIVVTDMTETLYCEWCHAVPRSVELAWSAFWPAM